MDWLIVVLIVLGPIIFSFLDGLIGGDKRSDEERDLEHDKIYNAKYWYLPYNIWNDHEKRSSWGDDNWSSDDWSSDK